MRNHRLPSGARNPAHRRLQLRPLAGDMTWFAGDQKAPEHVPHVGRMAMLDQESGKVGTPDQAAMGMPARALECIVDTIARQAPPHLHGAPVTKLTQTLQALLQLGVADIYAKSDDMYGATIPGHRYFDAGHQIDSVFARRRCRLTDAIQGIVIGQRQHLDTGGRRACDQLGRRERAVRGSRVGMQVVPQHNVAIVNCLSSVQRISPESSWKHRHQHRPSKPSSDHCKARNRLLESPRMNLPPSDIVYVGSRFERLAARLEERWSDELADAALQSPSQLREAFVRLTNMLRPMTRTDATRTPPEPAELSALANYALQLVEHLGANAQQLDMPAVADEVAELGLPLALWFARQGGELHHLKPVVDAVARFANRQTNTRVMAELCTMIAELVDAVAPAVAEDPIRSDPHRPWRLLLINHAIVATRSHNPALMEPALDAIVEHLPEDAASFFTEGMQQMDAIDYPMHVRRVMQHYFNAYGSKRVLH